MKKKIIYILVFLVCVSLVSASVFNLKLKRKKGEELVTCSDFLCDTDWTQNNMTIFPMFSLAQYSGGGGAGLISQPIDFKQGTTYNVTVEMQQDLSDEYADCYIELNGVTSSLITTPIYWSELLTATDNTDILYLHCFREGFGGTNFDSISVKEIKKKFNWKLKTKNTDGIFRWKLKRS